MSGGKDIPPEPPASLEAAAQYEFTAAENGVMGGSSRAMQAASLALVALALLQLGLGGLHASKGLLGAALVGVVKAAVFGLVAVWTWRAARSFGKVVTTQGSDITHVMTAVEDLRWAFVLHGGLLLLLVGATALFMGTSGLARSTKFLAHLLKGAAM